MTDQDTLFAVETKVACAGDNKWYIYARVEGKENHPDFPPVGPFDTEAEARRAEKDFTDGAIKPVDA